MKRIMLSKDQPAPEITTNSINNQHIDLSRFKGKKVLVKFHRFSGCPIAQWQINEFIDRQTELNAVGIETIIFLHSSISKILSNFREVSGLHIIADRKKKFYQRFHSRFSWLALFSWASWRITFAAIFHGYFPHFNKFEGGITGIPSDFLINEQNRIEELNYGRHLGDSWNVSEVLTKVH